MKTELEDALHVLELASGFASFGGLNGDEIRASIDAFKAALSQQEAVGVVENSDFIGFGAERKKAVRELYEGAFKIGDKLYTHPQPQKVEREPEIEEGSETKGMNLGERIARVGGRENAAGYIEFGSVMAVQALIAHVLRDIDRPSRPTAQGLEDDFRNQLDQLGQRNYELRMENADLRTLMAGKVLVPVEPSLKMIDATFHDEIETSGEIESHNTRNRRIYKAMLTASKEGV